MIDWKDFVNIILKLFLLERFHFSFVVLNWNLLSKSHKKVRDVSQVSFLALVSLLCGTG